MFCLFKNAFTDRFNDFQWAHDLERQVKAFKKQRSLIVKDVGFFLAFIVNYLVYTKMFEKKLTDSFS